MGTICIRQQRKFAIQQQNIKITYKNGEYLWLTVAFAPFSLRGVLYFGEFIRTLETYLYSFVYRKIFGHPQFRPLF